jgi:CheY-like chemotaxis protein
MPIMDGLSMCRRIRDWEQEVGRRPVPVVSLSANSFAEGWSQSSSAGFSHFCPKPVQFRDLGHIILELTDPAIPHRYLSDRQMPKHMLKKLGLLPQDEEDSDEEIEL